jgi:hypothetical protein
MGLGGGLIGIGIFTAGLLARLASPRRSMARLLPMAIGCTVGFNMLSPEQCDAFHAAGVANGGTTGEDPPGWRNGSVGRLYLAYLRDPDGNKICALHRPAKSG